MKSQVPLPIDDAIPNLKHALENHPAAVLRAPTGSGKTTRVPIALLQAGLLGDGQLIMLQPRRVAARACARTMARALGENTGETIGYQVRFERRASAKTRIMVVTEGILTRRFTSDPLLDGVTAVVLDEFHERSIHTDLALALLRELMGLRDDLKLLVMSATLDVEPLAAYLDDCPVIDVAARAFPLAVDYLDPPGGMDMGGRCGLALTSLFEDPADDGGNVLVFLPGAPEIRKVQSHLEQNGWPADLIPLHGSLPPAEQDAVLTPSERRRIILATNLAETSLTIPGVTAVVDSGFHKTLIHDPMKGIDRLDLRRISQASATQRAGRAGRTGPGRVIRLWSQERQVTLAESDSPEIARVDLASMLLQVLDFHGPELNAFPFFEPPPEAALQQALALLVRLGAISGDHRLTDLGKQLLSLPLHPRLGRIMARGAAMERLPQAARLCAILSESWTSMDLHEALVGHITQLPKSIRDAEAQIYKQAARLWQNVGEAKGSITQGEMTELLLAGYPDRLCRLRGPGQGTMVGGRGVEFETPAGAPHFELFLALELMDRGNRRVAAKAGRIVPVTLTQVAAVLELQVRETAVFDESRQAVAGVRQTVLGDLVLREQPGVAVDDGILAATLAQYAMDRFEAIFKPDMEAKALLFRLRFAAQHLPEAEWPDVSEAGLKQMLPTLCVGKKRFEQLQRLDWRRILLDGLDWKARHLLDSEVPERLEVPSGSRITIDYEAAFTDGGLPVLAVRLQEMFGQADTPMLAKGRVPILCHLLAPNMRPAQVTRDLRGFWNGTYAEVRKELRSRYPKHAWPEDPWAAEPIRGAKRRK